MRENKTQDQDRLILYYPPTWHNEAWRESLPLGNGQMGALVSGCVMQEDVIINDSRLWSSVDNPPLPDISASLAYTRKLMDEGRYTEAAPQICYGLIEQGYTANVEETFPMAHLSLRLNVEDVFTSYKRILDMRKGTAHITYQLGGRKLSRKAFISRVTDTFYYEITADRPVVDCTAALDFVMTSDPYCRNFYNAVKPTINHSLSDGWMVYTASNNGGKSFYGVVMSCVQSGGAVNAGEDGLRISEAFRVELRGKTFVGETDPDQAVKRLKDELESDLDSFESNLALHAAEHGKYYDRVKVDFHCEDSSLSNEELLFKAYRDEFLPLLAQKLWSYGRYLYISATREGGRPSPMYGLWHGQYHLIWAIYMANVNLQMMNWQAPVGNLSELLLPLMQYYLDRMEVYRDNARKLFGCRGIYIPSITTPNVHSVTVIVPVIVNWIGAAGWLAQHFYRYYEYTGDRVLLRDKILPFMLECAQFYEDYLQRDANGNYCIYPSVSPENTPGNFMPGDYRENMGHIMPSAVNATMDVAIIRELLSNLIEVTALLGVNDGKRGTWEDILKRLPDYTLNEDGALKEWLSDEFTDNYNHRHYSHLYPLFPGNEMIERNDGALIEGCREAMRRRVLRGQSGWSFPLSCCEYARLGDADRALDTLKAMAKGCLLNNFFTMHNDWRKMGVTFDLESTAPVQLDAVMGTSAAIQEMLVSCFAHEIRVLPALPSEWQSGEISGARHHTGTISISWDLFGGVIRAELTLERATDITVKLPEGFVWDDMEARTCPVCGGPGDAIVLSAHKARPGLLREAI